MNRNEKRERERKTKNLKVWLMSFNAEQKMLWEQTILSEIEKNDKIVSKILDDCFMAAMIENTDLKLMDIKKIIEKSNKYIEDTKKFIEEKGDLDMLKDEKLRSEIKEEAKIIIKENTKINNLRVIDALKENYDLPTKDFQIIIKEARKELEAEKMEELESLITEESNIEVVKATVKEVQGAELKEEITADTPGVKANGLKIKSIEVEGKYGIYVKDENGVTADGNPIKDIEMLSREKEGYLKRQYDLIAAAENEMKELKEHLEKLEMDKENELNKYAEIAAVFEM